MKKTIWMFSGQGSQYYGMGRDLYENEPTFRETLREGDAVVAPLINTSLVEALYAPRVNRFEPFLPILQTHPAIVLVEVALARLLLERGQRPDFLLGYSLGEYTALIVSGALTLEQGLVALVRQAALLEYAAPRGGMAAILEDPEITRRWPELFAGCEVAGVHFNRNFVVSAPGDEIAQRLLPGLRERGVSAMELPVSFPFHSRWMDAIATPANAILSSLSLGSPSLPMISAATGAPWDGRNLGHLWKATRSRIHFSTVVASLEEQGSWRYVDLGPAGSMATAVKYNLRESSASQPLTVMTPYGNERKHLARVMA